MDTLQKLEKHANLEIHLFFREETNWITLQHTYSNQIEIMKKKQMLPK